MNGRRLLPTLLRLLLTILCFFTLVEFAWCQRPPPLPSPGELSYIDNVQGDESKVVFWWSEGWLPPRYYLEGTRNVDPNNASWCVLQPTYSRFIFGFTNGVYSIAPAKYVLIDTEDLSDPCVPVLGKLFTPQVWHVRLTPWQ